MPMAYKCDDCGVLLGEHDNVAGQLDMTGKAYCYICHPKHIAEHVVTSYGNSSPYVTKEKKDLLEGSEDAER